MNYNNKIFKLVNNSENGETSSETVFRYQQTDDILSSEYAGGKIKKGHLIGLVDKNGCIQMCYHQVNTDGKIMTGTCHSTPEIMANGKIRLYEKWKWTSGDFSEGSSVLEEI
ncbi:MAG: n-acetylglutamate synthase [Crocinitomicaceae bacterium]|nr:n-acetylglutamate synthase [Crocinitomicaceae bacterium]